MLEMQVENLKTGTKTGTKTGMYNIHTNNCIAYIIFFPVHTICHTL